jgi:hypothetical protein
LSAPARAGHGVLDTSVLVAAEMRRELRAEALPETAWKSPVATRDRGFDALAGVAGLTVIEV